MLNKIANFTARRFFKCDKWKYWTEIQHVSLTFRKKQHSKSHIRATKHRVTFFGSEHVDDDEVDVRLRLPPLPRLVRNLCFLFNADGFGARKTSRTERVAERPWFSLLQTSPRLTKCYYPGRESKRSCFDWTTLWLNCQPLLTPLLHAARRLHVMLSWVERNYYSWTSTYYSGIIPYAEKQLLFPKLCRHNVRKPSTLCMGSLLNLPTQHWDYKWMSFICLLPVNWKFG